MQDDPDPMALLKAGGQRVRLRTLVILRWIAVAGQLAAILVAARFLGLRLETGLLALAVGASVIVNLVAMALAPRNRRLGEGEAAAMLLFDLVQLAVLLALTGGLNNPFAILILAPVTISAAALRPASTAVLGAVAIVLITIVWRFHLPLVTSGGEVLALPPLLSLGFWSAIVIGIAFLAGYVARVAAEGRAMSQALLATQMALEREQRLTDIGGIVAAAAHELGTPLATIKLASAELAEELAEELGDRPDLAEDVALIREQADRCRDILRSMGEMGKDDRLLRLMPIEAVVQEAARPHERRGREILISARPMPGGRDEQPVLLRRAELIHGLRNLIQNAVDFAESRVWVDIGWSEDTIVIHIADDGPGYPADVLDRIGDPFVRRRTRGGGSGGARAGYEGMGLGLFIAKTLLERTGAVLTFANAADVHAPQHRRGEPCGAVVEVRWPFTAIAAPAGADRAALGSNMPYRAEDAES
ncbi:sensor histidine kinase RegB [Meinhardsimonia xiamenensis]|nr:ActS/PrrB/RegB family redox-sensitive histidine kinase [Meinhardsimonia xiamenensis]